MGKIERRAEKGRVVSGGMCDRNADLATRSRSLFALKSWITCGRLVWRGGSSRVARDEGGLWGDVVSVL